MIDQFKIRVHVASRLCFTSDISGTQVLHTQYTHACTYTFMRERERKERRREREERETKGESRRRDEGRERGKRDEGRERKEKRREREWKER